MRAFKVMFSNHDAAGTLWGHPRGQERSKGKVCPWLIASGSGNRSAHMGSVRADWDEWGGDRGERPPSPTCPLRWWEKPDPQSERHIPQIPCGSGATLHLLPSLWLPMSAIFLFRVKTAQRALKAEDSGTAELEGHGENPSPAHCAGNKTHPVTQ